MFFVVYRYLFAPLAVLLLPFLALVNSKIRQGLKLRRIPKTHITFTKKPIWIHASSGEFEYAKSIIRELKKQNPDVPILVTHFSPTYAGNIQRFPGVDLCLPLPIDLPGPVKNFLRLYSPSMLLIARTDFWPEVLHQTRLNKIPISVFGYTQKKATSLTKQIYKWRLTMVDQIFCVDLVDQKNIESLDIKIPTLVTGDPRYDQVRFRLNTPKPLNTSKKPKQNVPCLIAGSTWEQDESILIPALIDLIKEKKINLILVPHEPSPKHIRQLQNTFNRYHVDYVLYSSSKETIDESVLLMDEIGLLAELYQWGQIAFIGGSFKRSVHSVMEALGAGCLTVVGPHHQNNREAMEFKEVNLGISNAVQVVHSIDDLKILVQRMISQDLSTAQKHLKTVFNQHLGSTQKVLKNIKL